MDSRKHIFRSTGPSEFSHAALIPTGPHQGGVLLWRFNVSSSCVQGLGTPTWLFLPSLQGSDPKLVLIHPAVQEDVFCSGLSWDRNGELVVAGGANSLGGGTPSRAFKFRPLGLGPIQWDAGNPFIPGNLFFPAWIELQSLQRARYYPTLFHLLVHNIAYGADLLEASPGSCGSLSGSSTATLGGPRVASVMPGTQPAGNQTWELLAPDATPTTNWSCPHYPPGLPSQSYPPSHDRYALVGMPDPETAFDTYPVPYHLASRRILVVGDSNTSEEVGVSPMSVANTPGEAWGIFPLHNPSLDPNQDRWLLYRGRAAYVNPFTNPTNDAFYAPTALIHQRSPLLFLDRVLRFGGSMDATFWPPPLPAPQYPGGAFPTWVVLDKVFEFESQAPNPPATGQWWPKAPLAAPRVFHGGLILPTGEILIVGGERADHYHGLPADPVFSPEIYDPGTSPSASGSTSGLLMEPNASTTVDPPRPTPRLYHSLAVLLPDGRVLVAGGGLPSSLVPEYPDPRHSGEIYSPPYLHQGFRPVFARIPVNQLAFGAPFTVRVSVKDTSQVDRVVLLRPAALTHHLDADQRYIELDFAPGVPVPGPGGTAIHPLAVTAPSSDLAPQGWYMLFVIEKNGNDRVPTVAHFVQIL